MCSALRPAGLVDLVRAQSNTVVVAGEMMKMKCQTGNESRILNWEIFTTNLEQVTVYASNNFHSRFKHFGVDVDDDGSGVLYTNSTNLSDAGIYKCLSVIHGEDKEHSAQLIVLETVPTCEENFTFNSLNPSVSLLNGDYIWMHCNVSFRGFWAPTIEWIEYGNHLGPEGRRITEEVSETRFPSRSVTSNLITMADSSRNGSHFACKIYFVKYDGKYNVTADNVPNFTYTWNSTVVRLISASESTATDRVSSPTDVSTAVAESASSTIVRRLSENSERPSSTDWYFISLSLVTALSIFFIMVVVLVTALCIRLKRKLSAKYATTDPQEVAMPAHDGDYDILPYATSDHYDLIDDALIGADLRDHFKSRHDHLPTPEYYGLTQMDAIAPSAYSKIDACENPTNVRPGFREVTVLSAIGTAQEHGDDSKDDAVEKEGLDVQQDGSTHPYIELVDAVEADYRVECNAETNCDISSSYLTVTF